MAMSCVFLSPPIFHQFRHFSTATFTGDETPHKKTAAISPIVGQGKPATREGQDWILKWPLDTSMDTVIREILAAENWSPAEIEREVENFLPKGSSVKGGISSTRSRRADWGTIESYQRTPWYRRWRPNESSQVPMVSHECMKLLEKNLIPPSARSDPYAHLRKRHYEDTFHTEKYSEGYVRHMHRTELAKYTKGMPQYGARSRKDFLEFETEYKRRQASTGQMEQRFESYNAWRASHKSDEKS